MNIGYKDMFSEEMEKHLQSIRENGADSLAETLTRLRSSITERIKHKDKWSQSEWIACKETRKEAENIITHEGIPLRITECLNDSAFDHEHLPIVKLRNLGKIEQVICLAGPSGNGKSVAAAWWLLQQPLGGRFVLASAIVALNEKLIEDRNPLHAIKSSPALVIDDLGRGSETPADTKKLGDLICERADNNLPTICTTMQIPDYGPSIIRRMRILSV
jgi:DNA replication protein DnaC